jgi:hypothetical protein
MLKYNYEPDNYILSEQIPMDSKRPNTPKTKFWNLPILMEQKQKVERKRPK